MSSFWRGLYLRVEFNGMGKEERRERNIEGILCDDPMPHRGDEGKAGKPTRRYYLQRMLSKRPCR